MNEDVLVTDLPSTSDDACYRAMDWLAGMKDEMERKVFDSLGLGEGAFVVGADGGVE